MPRYERPMYSISSVRSLVAAILLFTTACAAAQTVSPARHVHFTVQAPANLTAPISGRLLIFLKAGTGDKTVDANPLSPTSTWVGGREVQSLSAGASVDVDPDAEGIASPGPFAAIPSGDYEVQVVLDVEHSYNYKGRQPEDWVSSVVALPHWTPGEGPEPMIQLSGHEEADPQQVAALAKAKAQTGPGVAQVEELESKLLTKFWGRPVSIKAWVILPPGYAERTTERYPTVYFTHGFGGTLDLILGRGLTVHDRMKADRMPPMIWIMLDESCAQGTHEFADSVNNGPWGAALTTEFIPYLEHKYRMDGKVTGRFLNGHSSGGWATLQLQINYPKIFGGTWSTFARTRADFHDFTGPDLYAANAECIAGRMDRRIRW